MKNLLKLGQTLSHLEQQKVNGGWRTNPVTCNDPYYSPSGICMAGDYLRPQTSVICCSA